MIDLRSDTVTKPVQGMLQAMVNAEVGDDVFAEDPTVNAFQQRMADLFGMEAGLFVPSGTMGNQLCLNLLTGPGDEVITDELGHIFNYESAAAAHLSSVQLRPLKGSRGKLNSNLVEAAIRPENEWDPHTRVIALENSTNKGGGACYSRQELVELSNVALQYGLSLHLDGARIWNAMVRTGIEPSFFGSVADTLSVCFSKGLGAPSGSMILGNGELIRRARRIRKMWGGGMRQTGLLAAAAEYAYEHHFQLLGEDHRRAALLAEAVATNPALSVDMDSVETNILLFDVKSGGTEPFLNYMASYGVRMVSFGPDTIRATFHFQVDDEDLGKVITLVKEYTPDWNQPVQPG